MSCSAVLVLPVVFCSVAELSVVWCSIVQRNFITVLVVVIVEERSAMQCSGGCS